MLRAASILDIYISSYLVTRLKQEQEQEQEHQPGQEHEQERVLGRQQQLAVEQAFTGGG